MLPKDHSAYCGDDNKNVRECKISDGPVFKWTAMDSCGRESKGKDRAFTEANMAEKLKEKGLFPTSIKEMKEEDHCSSLSDFNCDFQRFMRILIGVLMFSSILLSAFNMNSPAYFVLIIAAFVGLIK